MSDSVADKIEEEVNALKNKVADRLKETEDLADLEGGLQKKSSGLVKTTEEHQQTSRETRNRLFFKWAKYTLILVVVIGLLIWLVFGPILKPLFSLICNKLF